MERHTTNRLVEKNHKATKSKTNTGTTALERSVEQTTGGFKALLQLAYFTLGPDATLGRDLSSDYICHCWMISLVSVYVFFVYINICVTGKMLRTNFPGSESNSVRWTQTTTLRKAVQLYYIHVSSDILRLQSAFVFPETFCYAHQLL